MKERRTERVRIRRLVPGLLFLCLLLLLLEEGISVEVVVSEISSAIAAANFLICFLTFDSLWRRRRKPGRGERNYFIF